MDRLPLTDLGTHRVDNQPDALIDYDPMRRDAALRDAVGREGAGWSADRLQRLSTSVGSEQYIEASMLANAHPPVLRRFDHAGRRVDEVVYTPAYHQLMGLGLAYWLAGLPWADPRQGSHVAHAAMVYLLSQADAGVVHPMSTTYAAVPLLRAQPDVAREWEHRLLAATYDPRCIPVHAKRAATIGLAVSSPDAGPTATPPSTLRATAHDTAGPGQTYALEGTLPICSAPMADAWITMATTSAGPSCFLVPRWCPDGQRNRLWLQRLRPTLGQRTSALAQLELPGSWARMIGDDGDGPATLTRMLHHVRLDAVVTRVACMRQALTQALHHARHRRVFGQPLLDQPLMRAVLADLALEVETAVALVMRVARSYDDARRDPSLQGASRLMVALAGAWVGARAPAHVAEALECLGGGGYVEDSTLPRLYRDAAHRPLGAAGLDPCLDAIEVMQRDPTSLAVLLDELGPAAAMEPLVADRVARAGARLRHRDALTGHARGLVDDLVLALVAAVILEHGSPTVARAFVATRLHGQGAGTYGAVPPGLDEQGLLDRAAP